MKYVIRYVKPHIPTMIFGFTIKFTGTILDLMIPYILSYICLLYTSDAADD